MINGKTFHPDMESECRMCGTSPTVVVYDPELRINSHTELCGRHFFDDKEMIDWELWNEPRDATE